MKTIGKIFQAIKQSLENSSRLSMNPPKSFSQRNLNQKNFREKDRKDELNQAMENRNSETLYHNNKHFQSNCPPKFIYL